MSEKDAHFDYEDDFLDKDRKQFRKERKIAVAKDRSKFKKTDQDQLKKRAPVPSAQDHLKKGRILAITPEGMVVDSEGDRFLCSLKGAMKQQNKQIKNLVAVGDIVLFEPSEDAQGVIAQIEERSSILSRADNLSRKKEQLIAVNIDQVLITTSVVLPPIKPFLIDRYIIAAHKGNMEPIILVNKIDLFDDPPQLIDQKALEEEKAIYEAFLKTYTDLGITIFPISAKTGEGIEALKREMQGKTSVFSGQSGVGKSSLINAVIGTNLNVGPIVESTSKGSHTTSTAHLIPIEGGGFCIDTPGIKSFGVWDLEKNEIQSYFSEIMNYAQGCKYQDCNHLEEPDCAVKRALEEGLISPLRYSSYCALMEDLSQKHRNR